MALKIHEYPITAGSIGVGDFFDMDKEISPGVYQSQKVPAALLLAINGVYGGSGTIANGTEASLSGTFAFKKGTGELVFEASSDGSVTFNGGQQSTGDFRVLSQNLTNGLFYDVSLNRLGINTSPLSDFHVKNASTGVTARIEGSTTSTVTWHSTTGNIQTWIQQSGTQMTFRNIVGGASGYNYGFRRGVQGTDDNIDKIHINPSIDGGITIFENTKASAITTFSNSLGLRLKSSYWTGASTVVHTSEITEVTPAATNDHYLDLADGIKIHKTGSTTFNGVTIGTNTHDPSAILELVSTTKGFSPPNMTTAERDAIVLPKKSLMIYNTTTDQWEGNNGTPGAPTWAVIG